MTDSPKLFACLLKERKLSFGVKHIHFLSDKQKVHASNVPKNVLFSPNRPSVPPPFDLPFRIAKESHKLCLPSAFCVLQAY